MKTIFINRAILRIQVIILCVFFTFLDGSVIPAIAIQPNIIINDLDWNANGTLLATGRSDGTIQIIDDTGVILLTSEVGINVSSVMWSPTQINKLICGDCFGLIQAFTFDNNQLTPRMSFATDMERIRKVAWSPDGTKVASIGLGSLNINRIEIWDTNSGTLLTNFNTEASLIDISWNPQNATLLGFSTTGDNQGTKISLWNVVTNMVSWEILEPDFGPPIIDWSPDGSMIGVVAQDVALISSTGEDSVVARIYYAEDGTSLRSLPSDTDFRGSIAWRNHPYIVIASNEIAEVWNPVTGQQIDSISTDISIRSISWRPFSHELSYGGTDGTVEAISTNIFLPPTAIAGSDQALTDGDNSGSETVTLDGSASSDPDGIIVSYSWSENEVEIATGVSPQVNLGAGVHTIMLTVTDNDGATDTDEVVITINSP